MSEWSISKHARLAEGPHSIWSVRGERKRHILLGGLIAIQFACFAAVDPANSASCPQSEPEHRAVLSEHFDEVIAQVRMHQRDYSAGKSRDPAELTQRAFALLDLLEECKGEPDLVHSIVSHLTRLPNDLSLLVGAGEREVMARRILRVAERIRGSEDPDLANVLDALAHAIEQLNRKGESEPLRRRSLAIREHALGPAHPEVAASLEPLAGLLDVAGRWDEALPLRQRVLAIRERQFEADHPRIADSLETTAWTLRQLGQNAAAVPLQQRALVIREKQLGQDHIYIARSAARLAYALEQLHRYDEAEALWRQAVAVWERALGPEHLDVAAGLVGLGRTLHALHRYNEAEAPKRRALAIRENVLGADHSDVAWILSSLAVTLTILARPAEAEVLILRALAIREKALGPDHLDVAWNLDSLANNLAIRGRLDQAEGAARRALGIREKALGPDHLDVASVLDTLVFIASERGRLDESEDLARRSLEIRENMLGAEHPDVAESLSWLARILMQRGKFAEGEATVRRALTIHEKTPDPLNPAIATTINILAQILLVQGRAQETEALFRRALVIYEKVFGPDHFATAETAVRWASAHTSRGELDEAETLLRRGLVGYEAVFGRSHPHVAILINDLATVLHRRKRPGEAVPLLRRALSIIERNGDPDNPFLSFLRANLALALAEVGQIDEALAVPMAVPGSAKPGAHLFVGEGILVHQITRSRLLLRQGDAHNAGELIREALASFEKLQWRDVSEHHTTASVLASQLVEIAEAAPAPEREVLHHDAFKVVQLAGSTSAAKALTQMSARAMLPDAKLAAAARRLESARRELIALSRDASAAHGMTDVAQRARKIDWIDARSGALETEAKALEAKLLSDAPAYAELALLQLLTLADLRALLRDDEALIVLFPGDASGVLLGATREGSFAAPIESGARLRELVQAVLAGTGAEGQQRGQGGFAERGMLRADPPRNERFDLQAAHELYKILLDPAETWFRDKKHLIIVPHGTLTGLPFQLLVKALPSADMRLQDADWLIRHHAISQLPALSSLRALRQVMAERPSGDLPFLGFGDPVIGDAGAAIVCPETDSSAVVASLEGNLPARFRSPPVEPAALVGGGIAEDGVAIADVDWLRLAARLPESRCEVEALAHSQGPGSAVLTGAEATEGKVKALSAAGELARYRVLAFATHGLLPQEAKGVVEAGLILTPPEHGTSDDDGLLTASEVAGLSLNADWVILSACNTAAGSEPGAETLSGLARAFFFAGARAVLVSHWPVDSQAAVLLTTRAFQELHREPGIGRAEALRRAMLSFLAVDAPDRTAHPLYWAPFSLVGDGGS